MYDVMLVGTGYWGSKILDELYKNPLVHTISITSKSNTEYTYESLLEDEFITHVFIATPVETHYELCKKAILAGKNVMCEKNFTPTYDEAAELIALAAEKKVNLLVDFIHSFNPTLDKITLNQHSFSVQIAQHGRFRDESVMSMLGCHALSVAAKFRDIKLVFPDEIIKMDKNTAYITYAGLKGSQKFNIFVTRESPEHMQKVRKITTIGGDIDFQYGNGIQLMINKFLSGGSNPELALQVARLIELTNII